MVRLLCFRVEWYLKNWVILKIQPRGSTLSNHWTSSFMQWAWKSEVEDGLAEEDKGEWLGESGLGILWRSSSSLRATEWSISPSDIWWLISLVMASYNLSMVADVAPCGACRSWIFFINGVCFLKMNGNKMEKEERWLETPLQGEDESRRSSPP